MFEPPLALIGHDPNLTNLALRALKSLGRAITDPEHRGLLRARILGRRQLHQTTALTALDRYPQIFSACREYFQHRPNLSILSFGCSTGEEVLTLRRYFPAARITGAEINRHSLAFCRRLPVDPNTRFIRSTAAQIAAHGPYDLIFCMAVLQRTPDLVIEQDIQDIRAIYPFRKFDRQLAELDSCLSAGGMLVLEYTQYQFKHAAIAARYQPHDFGYQPDATNRHFNPDGTLDPSAPRDQVAFIKV